MNGTQSLGPLEEKIMSLIWDKSYTTGRQVWNDLKQERQIAYTTVMTIMNRLVNKGVLSKSKLNGKTYEYKPSESRQQTLKGAIQSTLNLLVERFGEEAVVAFMDEADSIAKQKKKKR